MTSQVEPAWDEASRGQAEALVEYEDDCCPGCGLHQSVLDDPENNVFTFEERVCKMCAGQDRFVRIQAHRDHLWDKHHEGVEPQVQRPSDGRQIMLRRLAPDEVAARRSNRGEG